VVAPSLIPKRAGDRVKTDRRDAASLAKLHRAGELTAVWVPDARHEAVRDLVRARLDAVHSVRWARQQLSGFLLRHGCHYGRPGPGCIAGGWPGSSSSRRHASGPQIGMEKGPLMGVGTGFSR
jgi:transposase